MFIFKLFNGSDKVDKKRKSYTKYLNAAINQKNKKKGDSNQEKDEIIF
jgi:hypothetical protein